MKKELIKEAFRLQQIAGIAPINEEFNESDVNSIAEAFQKAGIDLNKPVVFIADAGNPAGTDNPATMMGGQLLKKLEDRQEEYDYEIADDATGVDFEFNPEQGEGELLGDYAEETQGLTCKLNVYFTDALLYEIWQDDSSVGKSAAGLEEEATDGYTGGYVEVMGPDFDKAMDLLNKAWTDWKNGPATESSDLKPAKQDILLHIKELLSFM